MQLCVQDTPPCVYPRCLHYLDYRRTECSHKAKSRSTPFLQSASDLEEFGSDVFVYLSDLWVFAEVRLWPTFVWRDEGCEWLVQGITSAGVRMEKNWRRSKGLRAPSLGASPPVHTRLSREIIFSAFTRNVKVNCILSQ